jgi:hypothetical protein
MNNMITITWRGLQRAVLVSIAHARVAAWCWRGAAATSHARYAVAQGVGDPPPAKQQRRHEQKQNSFGRALARSRQGGSAGGRVNRARRCAGMQQRQLAC